MFELEKRDDLIKQDSAQNNQLGASQAFDGHLTAPFEHIFRQTIERSNILVPQAIRFL